MAWTRLAVALAVAGILGWFAYGQARSLVASAFAGTVIARVGRVETVVSGPAVIALKERVIVAPVAGVVRQTAQEGDWVRSGAEVVTIANPAVQREVESRLAELDARIADYRAAEAGRTAEIAAGLADLGGRLGASMEAMRRAAEAGDVLVMADLHERIKVLADERRKLEDEKTQLAGGLSALLDARAKAESRLQGALFQLVAARPGYISYTFDGLEERLSLERLKGQDSRALLPLSAEPARVPNGAQVDAGAPVFKVADGDGTLVAVVLPNADGDYLAGHVRVHLVFPEMGNRRVPAEAIHFGPRERTGYRVVIFSTEGFLPEFLRTRRTKVDVVAETYEGIVVPRRALVTRDGTTGVYVVRRTVVRWEPVAVVGGNATAVVISGLDEGAAVVTTPWLVKDGLTMR